MNENCVSVHQSTDFGEKINNCSRFSCRFDKCEKVADPGISELGS
jgi:hypothetical protein